MKVYQLARKRLYRELVQGKLHWAGKPVYEWVVGSELMVQRGIDCLSKRPSPSPKDLSLVNEQLTAVIKTFERPHILKRLVASIRRMYPDLHLIVVDDSKRPLELEGVELITLPYDSGVSAGKNAGLEQVKTPYVLMLDDDFIFYRHTRLEPVLSALVEYTEIDIMGGDVIYLPFYNKNDYRKADLFPTQAEATRPQGTLIGGYPVYDKVANFYIGRSDRVRLVGWDPQLKRVDHADFFTRAKGVLTTVFNHEFKCLHAQNRFDKVYMDQRHDYTLDQAIMRQKYYRTNRSTGFLPAQEGQDDRPLVHKGDE